MKKSLGLVVGLVALALFAARAQAIPELQTYIGMGSYDASSETWINTTDTFTLFVAGQQSHAHGADVFTDVNLYVAVQQDDYLANPTGSITIQGLDSAPPAGESSIALLSWTLGFGGTAPDATNTTPDELARHGIFPATWWLIDLPNLLVSAGEQVPNYAPDADLTDTKQGDIQYYQISFTGFESVHFDVTALDGTKRIVAPFSHDSEGHLGTNEVLTRNGAPISMPEPTTMALLGLGLAGVLAKRRRRT